MTRKQLAYLLARSGLLLDLESGPAAVADDAGREALQQIMRRVLGFFGLFL